MKDILIQGLRFSTTSKLWIIYWIIGVPVMRQMEIPEPSERLNKNDPGDPANRFIEQYGVKWSLVGAFMLERKQPDIEHPQHGYERRPKWNFGRNQNDKNDDCSRMQCKMTQSSRV